MKRAFFVLLAVLFFSVAFVLFLGYAEQSPALKRASYALEDVLFKARYASETLPVSREALVVIAIDDESSFRLGLRWPWPRTLFAAMVEELAKKKADVIGLNFTFTGLEDAREDSTRALADAAGAHGRVVVGSTLEQGRILRPNPILIEAGVRDGFLEKIVDEDFVIRRSYPARPGPSGPLSFPLALLKEGTGPAAPRPPPAEEGGTPINYLVKPRDLRTIPAWKLLGGYVPEETLRQKTVLVGITSSLISEQHRTPLGLMPGVVVHANEWVAFREERPLRPMGQGPAAWLAWALGAALLGLSFEFFPRIFLRAGAFRAGPCPSAFHAAGGPGARSRHRRRGEPGLALAREPGPRAPCAARQNDRALHVRLSAPAARGRMAALREAGPSGVGRDDGPRPVQADQRHAGARDRQPDDPANGRRDPRKRARL
jgi:CHASE2 domain-containing sensor protein